MERDIIIYDWLSFTVKTSDPHYIIALLGLKDAAWTTTKGAHGYRERLYYDHISIHYDGRSDMGVWCEMSGQGCRAFESFSTLDGDKWQEFFRKLKEHNANVTRLDVAFDDHTGLLDLGKIVKDTQAGNFISKSDYAEYVWSTKGETVQVGSPASPVLIRIYDKARERNCPEGTHWNRVELQLRDERAQAFLEKNLPIGKAFYGTIFNYLRFVKPMADDSNRWRWPMRPYWKKLLGEAERVKLYEAPGIDYNLDRLNRIVFQQYGNAIDAALEIYGTEHFVEKIKERKVRRNPKYEQLVDDTKEAVYRADERLGKQEE